MTGIDRRTLLGGLAAAGGAISAQTALAAPAMRNIDELRKEADVACVYHCDFGDAARFSSMISNINNHYSVYEADPFALQIFIVAHNQGVKFFLDSVEGTAWKDSPVPPEMFARIIDSAKNGLKVYLCDITFKKQNISKDKVRPADFIAFVPSGVATVAALQGKGFAYIKVG